MTMKPDFEPEFSRLITPSELGARTLTLDLEADARERGALAARFGLVELSSFRARVSAKWVRGGRYLRLAGRIEAELIQTCVVTLEPVPGSVDEGFEALYYPETTAADNAGEPIEEDAEPLISDSLDVGETVAEGLALAIEPYPRKPGASLELGPSGAESGAFGAQADDNKEGVRRPFEGLAALRGNK